MHTGAIQRLSLVTAVAVYVLIVLGGIVTATGSGLACPDWPLCNGRLLPQFTTSILIEWTHRLWTVIVTLLVISTMILAWYRLGWSNRITVASTLAFAVLLGEVFLGMVTVRFQTAPALIAAHLALGTIVFAGALTTTLFSFVEK